jgi:hypothetical protein
MTQVLKIGTTMGHRCLERSVQNPWKNHHPLKSGGDDIFLPFKRRLLSEKIFEDFVSF